MAYPSRPERLVMRGLGIGCELQDLDERSRFFWLRTGNMDHANAARMVGEKHNVTLERNDFRLEHVRHPSFWKDDHVATLERNGLRLEVVGKFRQVETRNARDGFMSKLGCPARLQMISLG